VLILSPWLRAGLTKPDTQLTGRASVSASPIVRPGLTRSPARQRPCSLRRLPARPRENAPTGHGRGGTRQDGPTTGGPCHPETVEVALHGLPYIDTSTLNPKAIKNNPIEINTT
jgi:hypothetical protein